MPAKDEREKKNRVTRLQSPTLHSIQMYVLYVNLDHRGIESVGDEIYLPSVSFNFVTAL